MPYKVALVGCGKIADGHVEELQKMPEVARVVAAMDLESIMAEQLATRYRLPAFYDDFDRMLDEARPDVVHVTTPPSSHLALATRAMDAGCHVFCEKPLTLRHADSQRLVAHAAATGKKLTVGYTYLFDPPALAMRELVREGVIGDVVHVESFFGYGLSGPFGSAVLGDPAHWVHRLPGKLFHNNIDHLLNKLVEFIDEDTPEILHAFGLKRRPGTAGDARDHMLDELRIGVHGRTTTAFGTFSSHAKPAGHFVRLYGTRNTAHVDYVNRAVTLESVATLPSAIGLIPPFSQGLQHLREGGKNALKFARNDFHFFSGLGYLFRAFYASVAGKAELPISHRDMLRVSWMLDEIFRQVPQDGSAS